MLNLSFFPKIFSYAFCFPGIIILVTITLVGGISGLYFVQIGKGLEEVPEISVEANAVLLHRNNIADIRPGAFSQLYNCTVLNLDHNKLTEIRADMWDGLYSLEGFGLSNNLIASLSEGAFSTLPSLTGVNLAENNLQEIDRKQFVGLSFLDTLYLSENPICTIGVGSFSELQSLDVLSLELALVTEITASLFQGLSSLRYLQLYQAEMSKFGEGVFGVMPNLTNLFIYGVNESTILSSDMFHQLSDLNILSFQQHKIIDIQHSAFINLHGLENLYLDWNQLKKSGLKCGLVSTNLKYSIWETMKSHP